MSLFNIIDFTRLNNTYIKKQDDTKKEDVKKEDVKKECDYNESNKT
jgi:hypothetical protein